ncbi:MAG: hypothetical protein ACOX3F_09880 [Kiritimatiellia bacterium]|jgi:hypothetical protein|nr:hypothetical protein [Lentisphaerota bacterium]
MKRALLLILAIAALALAAGTLNVRLLHQRTAQQLTLAPPTENLPPTVALTTIALGGFRGILADILWMRAGALQEEGRHFELVQLADWISRLQPRSPAIWAFHAWNMAYNISTLMTNPDERWRWVHNGIRLLRDEALPANPGAARLYQELAWIFLHKLGTDSDPAAPYYRERWAAEVASGAVPLNPDIVRQITEEIAPLDWQTPQAQAIYWAMSGLPRVRSDHEDLPLRRIIYQALMQRIALGDHHLLEPAIRYVQDTRARHPHIAALATVEEQLLSQRRPPSAVPPPRQVAPLPVK